MTAPLPTKREAIAILERGDREIERLLKGLPRGGLTRRGIGGGDWSPVDLLGHLASWERHAVDALEAWRAGRRAPIDLELTERGVGGVNAAALVAAAVLRPADVSREARRTHAALLEVIRRLSDDAWERPPLTRGRPLGLRLGSILGGPAGPFRHADAHIPDLSAFVIRRPVS